VQRAGRRMSGAEGLRAGCSVLVAAWWMIAAVASAPAPIANAKIDTRSPTQGLEREVRAVAATGTPTWIGYRLPAAAGSRRICSSGARILLEAPKDFFVLARVEAGRVVRIRAITPECEVDAGGMPVVWLTGVTASESVEWLAGLVNAADETRNSMQQIARPAMTAVGLHADAGAPKLLEIARTTRNQEVRRQAMAQLAQSSDPRTVTLFEEILKGK
jgi:hypothetical protein